MGILSLKENFYSYIRSKKAGSGTLRAFIKWNTLIFGLPYSVFYSEKWNCSYPLFHLIDNNYNHKVNQEKFEISFTLQAVASVEPSGSDAIENNSNPCPYLQKTRNSYQFDS